MNERLEILLGRALDSAVPETWTTLTPEQFAKVSEKFAELIVDESARNLEMHSTCFDGDVGRGIKIAVRLTKEHFGVK